MLKKNLIPIIIFLALILISALYFFSNNNGTLSEKEASFACNDLSLVTSISIKKGDSVFVLSRKNNNWYYNSKYIVKHSLMALCYRIFSQVEIKSAVSKKTLPMIIEKMKQSGIEIKIFRENKLLKHYFIWADTQHQNIYMMMADKEVPFIVTLPSFQGNFAALFRNDPKFWRDLTILHYTPAQIATVKVEQTGNEGQSFRLDISSRGKTTLTDLKFGKARAFKTEAVEAYLFCFRNIKAENYIEKSDETIKKLKRTLPLFKVSVTDHEGNNISLEIFSKESETNSSKRSEGNSDVNFCYVLINEKELAVAKYIETDPITRDLKFFLQQ
jgi:hypothetical protein